MLTLAQQCANAFMTQTKTVSVNALAVRLKGERVGAQWKFPDGSALVVKGRGRSHKMTVLDEGVAQ